MADYEYAFSLDEPLTDVQFNELEDELEDWLRDHELLKNQRIYGLGLVRVDNR